MRTVPKLSYAIYLSKKLDDRVPHFVYLFEERPLIYKAYIDNASRILKKKKNKILLNGFYKEFQAIDADPYQENGILIQKRDIMFYGYGNPNILLNKIIIIQCH